MQRHESAARLDKIQQRLLPIRRNLRPVGVNQQTIISRQFPWTEIVKRFRVIQFDTVMAQHGFELFEPVRWPVMTVVTEKQDAERRALTGVLRRRLRRRKRIQTCADPGCARQKNKRLDLH